MRNQLLEVIDEWTLAVDEGRPTDFVYIDFEKAFNKVQHSILIDKLEYIGIRNNLLNIGLNLIYLEGNNVLGLVVLFHAGPGFRVVFRKDQYRALYYFLCLCMIFLLV